jgi:hypothetical protein
MVDTLTGTKPASWTVEEDAKFVAILEEQILKNGKNLEAVYAIVAEAVGRPEGGCKYRYTNVIRKSLTGKLKEKLVTNSPRANVGMTISQGVNQINHRSKLIQRLTQVDKELNKIDMEIEKAAKAHSDLKAKKLELGQEMTRYTDLLVKSAMGESAATETA